MKRRIGILAVLAVALVGCGSGGDSGGSSNSETKPYYLRVSVFTEAREYSSKEACESAKALYNLSLRYGETQAWCSPW